MVQLTSRSYFAVLSTVLILDSIQSRPIGSVILTNRDTSITSSTSIQDESNLVTRARLPTHQTPLLTVRSEKEEEEQSTKPPKNFGRLSSNRGVTAHAFTENELSALQNPHRKRNDNDKNNTKRNTSTLVDVGGNVADDENSENEASDGTGDIADEMYPLRIRQTTTNTFKSEHLPFDQSEGKNKLEKRSLMKKSKRNAIKRENGHESEESNHHWTSDDENGKGTYWVGNHAATQNGANNQQQPQPNSFVSNGMGGYAKLKKRSNEPNGHESSNHWTTDEDNGKGVYRTPQKPFKRRSPYDQSHNTNQHHNINQYHNVNQDHNENQHHNKGKGTASYGGSGNGEGEGGAGTEVASNQLNTATQSTVVNTSNVNQPAVGSGGGNEIAIGQAAGTTSQINPAVADTAAVEENNANTATAAAPERRSTLKKRSNSKYWQIGRDTKEDEERVNPALDKRNNVPDGHESTNHWTTDEDNGKGAYWTQQKPFKRRSPYDQPHNTNQHHNTDQYHNTNQDHNENQHHNKGKSTGSYAGNENGEVVPNQSNTATNGLVNQPAAGTAASGGDDGIATNQAAGTTSNTNPAVADTTANANGAVEGSKADTASTAAPERRSTFKKRSNTKLWLVGRDGKEDEEDVNPALATYFNNSKEIHKRFTSSFSMKKQKNELIKRQITDSEEYLTAQQMDDESSSDIDREVAIEQKPEHVQGLEDVHDECMENEKQGILPSGTCEAQRMSSALAGSVRKREETSAVFPPMANSTTVESTKVPFSPTHVRPPSQTEMALEALSKLNDLQAKRNDVQEQEELIEKQIHDLFKEYPVLSATLAL